MQPVAAAIGGTFDLDAAIRLAGLDSFTDREPSKDDIDTVFGGLGFGQYAGLDEKPARGIINFDLIDEVAGPLKDNDPEPARGFIGEQNPQRATGDGAVNEGNVEGSTAEQPVVVASTITSRGDQDSEPDWGDLWTSRRRDPILDEIIGENVCSSPTPTSATTPPVAPLPVPHHSDASTSPRSSGPAAISSAGLDIALVEVMSPSSVTIQTPSLVADAPSIESTSAPSPSTPTCRTAAVSIHDQTASVLDGTGPTVLGNAMPQGLTGEALPLAKTIAAHASILVETLRSQPATPANAASPTRDKGGESMVPQTRSGAPAIDDAYLALFCSGMSPESRAEAERIAAGVGRPGSTALNAMIGSQPMEGIVPKRLLKRARDDEGIAHTTNKRAKGANVRQQVQQHSAAWQRSVVTISHFTVTDESHSCNDHAKLLGHDTEDMVSSQMENCDTALFDDDSDDGVAVTCGMDSAPRSDEGGQDDEVSEQQQGAAQSSAPAPAGLGQPARAGNNKKTSLGKAIEKNGLDRGRLLVEAQIALRILERPDEALPNALRPTVASWFKEDLRVLMGLLADAPVCEACFTAGHPDCGKVCVVACSVCGCPVARGDWTQCHRHRINKCPGWCALVAAGRHKEWLELNGLLEKLTKDDGDLFRMQKQFFCDNTRAYANAAAAADQTGDKDGVRRQNLLNRLDAKEVEDLKGEMTPKNPFAMIQSLTKAAVVERLRAEIRAEASSSATTIDA